MNIISVSFVPCEPTPVNGYNIQWRVFGSGDPYTDAGNFTSSPAVFIDEINPQGTSYEGTIRSDCTDSGESGNYGTSIPWTAVEESTPVCRNYSVTNNHVDNATFAYITCGGSTTPVFMTPGQTIVVCALEGEVFADAEFTITPLALC